MDGGIPVKKCKDTAIEPGVVKIALELSQAGAHFIIGMAGSLPQRSAHCDFWGGLLRLLEEKYNSEATSQI